MSMNSISIRRKSFQDKLKKTNPNLKPLPPRHSMLLQANGKNGKKLKAIGKPPVYDSNSSLMAPAISNLKATTATPKAKELKYIFHSFILNRPLPPLSNASQKPSTPILHSESKTSIEELAVSTLSLSDNVKMSRPTSYLPSNFQLQLYDRVCPDSKEHDLSSSTMYYQMFDCGMNINLEDFKSVLTKICQEYTVMSTAFYRNEKIIDADMECLLSYSDDRPPLEFIELAGHPDKYPIEQRLGHVAKGYLNDTQQLKYPFRAIIAQDRGRDSSYLIAMASNALIDSTSLLFVIYEAFRLYEDIQRLKSEKQFSRVDELMEDFIPKEKPYAFCNFNDLDFKPSKESMQFWKGQFKEYTQENVSDKYRLTCEERLKRLEGAQLRFKGQAQKATKQKQEAIEKLAQYKQERCDYENEVLTSTTYFIDPESHEKVDLTPSVYRLFAETLDLPEEDAKSIPRILQRYHLEEQVIEQICQQCPTFEKFLEISEENRLSLDANSQTLRQIYFAAEFCRYKMVEMTHHRGKHKYALERLIWKMQREIETANINFKMAQKNMIQAGEEILILKNLINPPLVEHCIEPLRLIPAQHLQPSPLVSKMFVIEERIMQRLQHFVESMELMCSSASESTLNLDSNAPTTHYDLRPALLASFGILLKNITGKEKFVLGLCKSFRSSELLVGPISEILPCKVDMTGIELKFGTLMIRLKENLMGFDEHARVYPYSKQPVDGLRVVFELVDKQEWAILQATGMTDPTLLLLQKNSTMTTHAKSIGQEEPHNAYDLKLRLIETDASMQACFIYNPQHFKKEDVDRWIEKFLGILEAIEFNRRKSSIAQLIARLYNPVFQL